MQEGRQVNRLLRKERRETNKEGKETCLYTSFIVMQQCNDDSVSSSMSQSWKPMETDRMISNQLSAYSYADCIAQGLRSYS